MLQMLSVYHVQVKAGNTSESLLNKIRHSIFFDSSKRNY